MAHKTYPNLVYTDDGWTAVWKLTRVMKAAGWVYKASGDGTALDTSGTASSDLWGGAVDPMTDTMPVNLVAGTGCWWLGQGPSTLKIPIGTNVPSAAMIRGEKITQATSLAEGELLGVITDTVGGTGYLVVAPRTGTFDGVNTITGAYSTATITPTATPIEYAREVIFWRATTSTSQGHWFYQCVDTVGEASKRFSARAVASGTASYPGQATAGDPGEGSMACIGTLTSTTSGTGMKNWTCSTNPLARGKSHLMCANAAPATGVSGDGSFIFAIGVPGYDASSYTGFAFQRCDDGEDGDVDPYVVFAIDGHTIFAGSRTAATGSASQAPTYYSMFTGYGVGMIRSGNSIPFRAFRRRGLSSESYGDCCGMILAAPLDAYQQYCWSPAMQNTGDAESVSTAVVTTRVREPIWVNSWQLNRKMRKGTLRWMFWVQGGGASNTYDNLQWVQLGASGAGFEICYGVVAGPWDGVSVPSNS